MVHLWDRDCSVQRRHQKVIECAPAQDVPPATRAAILRDAVTLLKSDNYLNAGTVEFLVDMYGQVSLYHWVCDYGCLLTIDIQQYSSLVYFPALLHGGEPARPG